MDKQREQFEAWAKGKFDLTIHARDAATGRYSSNETWYAWCAWQAAQAAPVDGDPRNIVADTGHPEADRLIGRLTSADPDFNDCTDAAVLIRKLVAEHKGPDGYATWKDAAIAERMRRVAAPGEAVRVLSAAEESVLHTAMVKSGKVITHTAGWHAAVEQLLAAAEAMKMPFTAAKIRDIQRDMNAYSKDQS